MPEPEKENALAAVPAGEKEELAVTPELPSLKGQPEPRPSGQVLKRVLGFILRLVLFLAFLAALAAGAYFGLPILYEKYVRPVEMNSSQLASLAEEQSRQETQLADLETRLATLEAAGTSQAESIVDLSTRVEALEESIAAHTTTLSALEEMMARMQAVDEESQAELERQINLLKSMELLSRARLFLYQSNFGLARQDVQVARDLLAEIQPNTTEPLDAEIAETLLRLDLVLQNLPSFPVVASDDLDIAWQILLSGIPPEGIEISTPTSLVTPESLLTPTSEPDATPTPTP